MTDLFLGDDSYHGGTFMLSANFGFYAFFHPQTEPQTPKQTVGFDFGTPDSYKFYLQAAAWKTWRGVSEGLQLALQRPDEARHLRRLLAGARPFAAHEEREVRGAGGGRMVRR